MMMPTTTNSAYWKKREKEERKWQEKNIATDAAFNRAIERYYNIAIAQINKDIDHQYQSLAKSVGGLQTAYSAVDAADIADHEFEAQKLVMQAAQMRAQGKRVTQKEEGNRNVMLNAASANGPREIQIGLPSADVNVLENGLPVTYATNRGS